ncbi:MAG: response regulator [Candidatus Riflebacteria bacterium]|jgi:CheY-like chemotaxis protein|nr:response regulator [Candidatus Riflebacteria bacterium]
MQKNHGMTILVAEDDPGHAELIRGELLESGVKNDIIRFANGTEAWTFLSENRDLDARYLLLLDIKMPGIDGVELLRRIKSSDSLKTIPVIMVSTTDDPPEIDKCYNLGCNVYITKPVSFDKFSETLKRLGLFIQIVRT